MCVIMCCLCDGGWLLIGAGVSAVHGTAAETDAASHSGEAGHRGERIDVHIEGL